MRSPIVPVVTRREYVRVGSATASLPSTVTPGTIELLRFRPSGFTLLELLVGMVIIGVLLGAVGLAFPDSAARRTELAAERALALLQLACERAQTTGRDIGIGIARQQLAFGPFSGRQWQRIADSPAEALRPRQLDAAVTLALRVDAREIAVADALPVLPQVACLASGEMTPFTLDIIGPPPSGWRVHASADGVLTREPGDARQ